jgi:hypothetical protein
MRICTKCEFDYPAPIEDFFHRKHDTKDGFQYVCKKCISLVHQEHYQKRKSYYKKKAKISNRELRIRNLQFIVDYLKTHPCVDCSESDPIVLEFDHQGDKIYNISSMQTLKLEKVKREIAKCNVRCANCHKRKTAKQLNYYQGIIL